MLCIPNEGFNKIVLEGSEIATKSKALIFEIKPCSNDTLFEGDLPCQDPDQIEQYLKDIKVETWANYDRVAIETHDTAPIERM